MRKGISKVEYIVAHGISSRVDGKKVIIGSYHFVLDEKCRIPEQMQEKFKGFRQNVPSFISRWTACLRRLF